MMQQILLRESCVNEITSFENTIRTSTAKHEKKTHELDVFLYKMSVIAPTKIMSFTVVIY